jgi:hypothetical protein
MVTNNKPITASPGVRAILGGALGTALMAMSFVTPASAQSQEVGWTYSRDGAYHFGGYNGPDTRWITPGPNYFASHASYPAQSKAFARAGQVSARVAQAPARAFRARAAVARKHARS